MAGNKSLKPHSWHQYHLWQITPIQDLLWIFLGGFLLWFGYQLQAIFTPLLIALALAYLFNPLIRWSEQHYKVPRPVTLSTLLIVLITGGILLSVWLGPEFLDQFIGLLHEFISYLETLVKEHNLYLEEELDPWVQQMEKDPLGFIVENIGPLLAGTTQAVAVIGQIIGTTIYGGVMFLLIPFYFFFLAWHFDALIQKIKELIPAQRRHKTLAVLKDMDNAVAAFFRGRLIISLITAGLFSIGWSPLLTDVPFWLVLGISAGILNFIPFASVIAWLAALLTKSLESGFNNGFDLWSIVVWPSLAYGIVQFIDSWLLTPWIQGRRLNLSSITIVIVVLMGGVLGGIYGLLLCIPLAACAKIIFIELILPRVHQWVEEH